MQLAGVVPEPHLGQPRRGRGRFVADRGELRVEQIAMAPGKRRDRRADITAIRPVSLSKAS
jgi:hypothetical protein